MSAQHHKAAALFEVVPAWLRFLQSKKLIGDEQRGRTLEELRPLHASLLRPMEDYTDDPTLYRSLTSELASDYTEIGRGPAWLQAVFESCVIFSATGVNLVSAKLIIQGFINRRLGTE